MADPLDEQYDEYLAFLTLERGLARNTVEAYARDLTDFLAAVRTAGHRDLRSVGSPDVSGWVRKLAQSGLARSSQKRMLVAVRGFFKFHVQRGGWDNNPCQNVALPKLPKPLPQTLELDEVQRLLREAPLRDRALIALWYGAGLRVSEAVGLQLGALHLEAGLIRVLGKGDKERLVPIGGPTQAILEAYIRDERPKRLRGRTSEFLFPGRGKSRALTRQAAFCVIRRLARAAGIVTNVSPHTLRHAFATHLVRGGADLRSVQVLLGHADLKTTEIYTHLDDRHVRQTYERTHPRA